MPHSMFLTCFSFLSSSLLPPLSLLFFLPSIFKIFQKSTWKVTFRVLVILLLSHLIGRLVMYRIVKNIKNDVIFFQNFQKFHTLFHYSQHLLLLMRRLMPSCFGFLFVYTESSVSWEI